MTNVRASPGYRREVIPFSAGDGRVCNLIHVIADSPRRKGPVLLVHGAGVRANIFCAPVRESIVDYLIVEGWDVWLENWRASIDLPPTDWTLDQAAVFDHPVAVDLVSRLTRSETIKAVIHCQGSTSFAMALAAGLLPQVTTVVSNAVSLHPVVPFWSFLKLAYTVPMLGKVTTYLDPGWGNGDGGAVGGAIRELVELTHWECDNSVCRLVSFTYGSGFPALWSHDLINAATHDWLRNEFGFVPLTFFRQMKLCVQSGELRPVSGLPEIPTDGLLNPLRTNARFALFAGQNNKCFLPKSQELTFAYLKSASARADHTLHILPEYSHLDVFMGRYAATDVFPLIAAELEQD